MSITDKQVKLLLSLDSELNVSKVNTLTKEEASFLIQELKENKLNKILAKVK